MSMSDELMILTIEKMQIELKRAMEDIQLLMAELQGRSSPVNVEKVSEGPVKAKRVIKLMKGSKAEGVKKKPTGIVTWNAFISEIRSEMQKSSDTKIKNEEVIAKATATKLADPDAYKAFCNNWLAAHPVL
jgi:hypothetical protein